MMDFKGTADDFFVNLNLQTTLALPSGRETVLHFCEAVQKEFRQMTSFFQRESGEYVLEGDREGGTYQWLELQSHHMSAGFFNPPDIESAYRLHRWLLDRSVYFLGISALDVECMDVLLGFNLDYHGNRDGIVAQALLSGSLLAELVSEGPGKPIQCEPSLIVALDEDCSLQARLSIETRSSMYQVRTGQWEDEPISVYLTVRQYPKEGQVLKIDESFARQCEACEDIVSRLIAPHVIQPIAVAIATAQ